MNLTLTKISPALETTRYRGTGGVSANNRSLGFPPAFIDPKQGLCIGRVFLTAGWPHATCWMVCRPNSYARAMMKGA